MTKSPSLAMMMWRGPPAVLAAGAHVEASMMAALREVARRGSRLGVGEVGKVEEGNRVRWLGKAQTVP